MTDLPHHSPTKGSSLILGIGCERGTDAGEVFALVEAALAECFLPQACVTLVASLDTRESEPAIRAVAERFGVPFTCFDARTLEAETPRLLNPSKTVFRHTGCHGVAEAAALAGAGANGRLIVSKRKSARATVAIAESFQGKDGGTSDFDSRPAAHAAPAGQACGVTG